MPSGDTGDLPWRRRRARAPPWCPRTWRSRPGRTPWPAPGSACRPWTAARTTCALPASAGTSRSVQNGNGCSNTCLTSGGTSLARRRLGGGGGGGAAVGGVDRRAASSEDRRRAPASAARATPPVVAASHASTTAARVAITRRTFVPRTPARPARRNAAGCPSLPCACAGRCNTRKRIAAATGMHSSAPSTAKPEPPCSNSSPVGRPSCSTKPNTALPMTSMAIAPNAGSVSVASHRPRQPNSRLRASARLRSSALPSVAFSSSSASVMNIDGGARKNGITSSTADAASTTARTTYATRHAPSRRKKRRRMAAHAHLARLLKQQLAQRDGEHAFEHERRRSR